VGSIGDRVPDRYQIPFKVRPKDLRELVDSTVSLTESDHWARDYQKIGERLCKVLLASNVRIIRDLGRLEGITGQRQGAQLALCFVVEKAVYPIALEALRDGYGDDRHYWLERAPLWRQLDLPVREYPLFQDPETREGPIDCLVVEANTSGEVSKWGLSFDPLPGVEAETQWLVNHLRRQDTVKVGKIGRIWQKGDTVLTSVSQGSETPRPQPGNGCFAKMLREMLVDSGPWHLVHFAGHSHYDIENDWGYVLLPGRPTNDGRPAVPDYVGTPEFAKWLVQTRLVYMSSCRGSSQDFVFNLCNHAIPAVTGFRWNIEDTIADEHCRTFYEELFHRRSIEDALYKTWNHMFGIDRESKVWASSQLVMQLAA
jgi:hypothetical protein